MLDGMTTWHPMQPCDESFFTTAAHVYRFPIDLPVPPARVWESLASERSVSAWGPGVQSLRWTSPRPFGVGATREVVLALRALTVKEEYFEWDEGKRCAFFVRAASRPLVRRMAEDYLLAPTSSGCRFTWTFAIEPNPKSAQILRLADPMNRLAFGQMARSSRSYFAKHPLAD
jgi:hypothetical protein